jgi:hypothetical protein
MASYTTTLAELMRRVCRGVIANLDLTMRLIDAGLRRQPTKLIYADHRLPPWLTEDATPRSLEPIVRGLPIPGKV